MLQNNQQQQKQKFKLHKSCFKLHKIYWRKREKKRNWCRKLEFNLLTVGIAIKNL